LCRKVVFKLKCRYVLQPEHGAQGRGIVDRW
jgi:hypothetical protein